MKRLSDLTQHLSNLNDTMDEVFHLIGESCEKGHVGEFIASEIFDIELFFKKTIKRTDGIFRAGPLIGKNVNIKFYPKREGILDLPTTLPDPPPPDYYLVLTGPKGKRGKKEPRPWVIDAVYLFDAKAIVKNLRKRDVNVGVASSVKNELWTDAEIYPTQRFMSITLSTKQKKMLRLFMSK